MKVDSIHGPCSHNVGRAGVPTSSRIVSGTEAPSVPTVAEVLTSHNVAGRAQRRSSPSVAVAPKQNIMSHTRAVASSSASVGDAGIGRIKDLEQAGSALNVDEEALGVSGLTAEIRSILNARKSMTGLDESARIFESLRE